MLAGALVTTAFFLAAIMYQQLPDPVPTHWNLDNEADAYMPKPWGVLIMPLVMLGFFILFTALPYFSPRHLKMQKFMQTWKILKITILGFLLFLTIVMMIAGTGQKINFTQVMPTAMGALWIALGNFMGKLTQNFFVGIRAPWTLACTETWNRTHRFSGKLWVLSGVLMLAIGVLSLSFTLFFIATLASALVPIGYSYRVYRKIQRKSSKEKEISTKT